VAGNLFAIAMGAVLGAWLRWWLGTTFNALNPHLPLGTLIANLVGGYLIGVAIEYLTRHAQLPPEVRLFVITGFLGALTTFSTFSAEAVALLTRGQYLWAFTMISSHLFGSIAMTLLGIFSVRWLHA
jgi:fluoride exporter